MCTLGYHLNTYILLKVFLLWVFEFQLLLRLDLKRTWKSCLQIGDSAREMQFIIMWVKFINNKLPLYQISRKSNDLEKIIFSNWSVSGSADKNIFGFQLVARISTLLCKLTLKHTIYNWPWEKQISLKSTPSHNSLAKTLFFGYCKSHSFGKLHSL